MCAAVGGVDLDVQPEGHAAQDESQVSQKRVCSEFLMITACGPLATKPSESAPKGQGGVGAMARGLIALYKPS